ncbi:hypothetical protein DMENIID0001_096730 [Sergentomyia squamirostris]
MALEVHPPRKIESKRWQTQQMHKSRRSSCLGLMGMAEAEAASTHRPEYGGEWCARVAYVLANSVGATVCSTLFPLCVGVVQATPLCAVIGPKRLTKVRRIYPGYPLINILSSLQVIGTFLQGCASLTHFPPSPSTPRRSIGHAVAREGERNMRAQEQG